MDSAVGRVYRNHAGPTPENLAGAASRWFLLATTAIAAMVPWYTLRLFPLLTLGTSKINLQDFLVAGAVACGIPGVVRAVRGGQWSLLWVPAFVAYMAVPFLIGLRDPGGVFFAVRELRALAFYLLAAAYATAGYSSRDFRTLAAVYVVSVCAASLAVFLQLHGVIEIPGYEYNPSFVARYLEWMVPVVAFTLALGGALGAETGRARLAWAGALPFLGWYLIAMQERSSQGIAVAAAIVLLGLPRFGALTVRRVAALAALLGVLYAVSAGLISGPTWLDGPVRQMIGHWSRALTDGSLLIRFSELRTGMPRFADHPVFGIGLGSVIASVPPDNASGGPWRYIASGYGFLLIKTGIVGLVLFAGMVGSAVHAAWRRLRRARDDRAWPRFSIAVTGLVVLLAFNLLRTVVDIPEGVIAFSLLYGMIMSRPE